MPVESGRSQSRFAAEACGAPTTTARALAKATRSAVSLPRTEFLKFILPLETNFQAKVTLSLSE